MCSKPEILLEPFAKAGADSITVHVELGDRVPQLFWKIRSLGRRVGLAVNPPTAIANAEPHLDEIDLLLVMTVNPGFGGQPFIHEMLPKIQQAAAWRRERGLNYRIEVDGGQSRHRGGMRQGRRGHVRERHGAVWPEAVGPGGAKDAHGGDCRSDGCSVNRNPRNRSR
jgi:ribulose-phosphate 3-epimerase